MNKHIFLFISSVIVLFLFLYFINKLVKLIYTFFVKLYRYLSKDDTNDSINFEFV